MKRDDEVAGTTERTTSAMVRPNCPARSRSMVISSVGIVELLRELQVAQEIELRQLRADLLRVGVVVREAGALHRDFDRRRRAEAHHLADDVAGFERDLRAGQSRREAVAKPFAQGFAARRVRLQGDLNDGFLRAAGEQVDQVDRIAGGHDADEVAGDRDVVRDRLRA